MNLYSFFRKKHSKPFVGAFFAAAFLSAFFAFKSPAEADYLSDYSTLFSGTSPAPLLKVMKLVSPTAPNSTTLKPDVQFNFQGSFPFTSNNPLQHEKKWYWDHIRDFFYHTIDPTIPDSGSPYVFMLRICDTNVTDEGKCLFSIVPHQKEMSDDESIFCPNGKSSCKLPGPTDPTSKIYHYTATINNSGLGVAYWLNHSDIQNDKFNVQFDVKNLSLLADGKLDTPISLKEIFKIGDPTTYKADIWYCSGRRDNEDLPTNEPTPNIRQFKNLCGGDRPYFKIAESSTFKMPSTVDEALNQTPETIGQVDTTASDSNAGSTLPVCVLAHPLTGEGSFMGCIAYIGYGIYQITAWIAGILGKAMDFFLGYSISDESYRASVVVTGWKLVRDISNIFFIIILVWTGFATVFNLSSVSMKKVVPGLIINALLINFSLFGTQVIIDISNITARLFYNTMSVCDGKCEYSKEPGHEKELLNPNTDGTGGYKPLSEKIVDSFDPQKIFKPGTLNSNAATGDVKGKTDSVNGGFNSSGIGNNIEESKKLGIYDSDYAIYFLIVSIIAAFIMLGMAKMFFGVMFMFVGRVVGLYMSMIFSPFAVLTRGNMPLVGGIKELSWDNWLKDLTNYALLAPIFVFFLYIIYAFINSDMLSILNLKESDSFMSTVISVVIPMIIIYMLVSQGVEIAKKYAGTAGNMIQKYATQATGILGGAALGVAGFAGARVIGGAAKRLDESRFGVGIRNMAAKGGAAGWVGKKLQTGLNTTRAGSFDVRQNALGQGLFKQLGINTNPDELKTISKGLSVATLGAVKVGLSTEDRKGGFDAETKRRQEEQEKKSKLLEEKMSDEQIEKYNKKQKDNRAKKIKEVQDNLDAYVEGAMEAQFGKQNVANWKENDKTKYDDAKAIVMKDAVVKTEVANSETKIAEIKPAKEIRSASELNSDRRQQFVANLKEVSIADKILGNIPLVGALLGSNVRRSGDAKAAKKLAEKTKAEKELEEIKTTLQKGFQDLIALDMFQNGASFAALDEQERKDIVKYGTIQDGVNKGQGMYDILTDDEKKQVDADVQKKKDARDLGTKDERKKAKEEYEELEDLIKARESNKYNLKALREDLKKIKQRWVDDPTDEDIKKEFREKLREVKIAEKHESKWRDINNYMKTQKDKLKDEDKK